MTLEDLHDLEGILVNLLPYHKLTGLFLPHLFFLLFLLLLFYSLPSSLSFHLSIFFVPFLCISPTFYSRIIVTQPHWGQQDQRDCRFLVGRCFLSFNLKSCFTFSLREYHIRIYMIFVLYSFFLSQVSPVT